MEHPSATDPSLSSPVFPSFLAQPSKLPSIFPSALFLLSAQQNAIGPKHCWLPLMLAALLVIGKSFMSSMSLNALNRGQSLATGPSTGRAKQKRRSLALTLTSCFSASSGHRGDFQMCRWVQREEGRVRAVPLQAVLFPASNPGLEMERMRQILEGSKISLLSAYRV